MRQPIRLAVAVAVACACALLAGCASAGSGVEQPATVETMRVMGTGQRGAIDIGVVSQPNDPTTTSVSASVDDVWRVLPAVYDSLGIPVTTRDLPSHTVGNADFTVRRRLGDVPLARQFDCGSAQGVPSADTYQLRLSVLSRIAAREGGGTTLATTVEAMGRPVAFSGEFVRCGSTRVLEARVADAVKARLAH